MLDIKVLGSGSSGNCYIVGDGQSRLLLDAGLPIRQIQAGCDYKVNEVAGCLVTHCHKDHSRAARDLHKRGIKVFAPDEMKKSHSFWFINPLDEYVKSNKSIGVGTFNVRAFRAHHDCQCYGYYIHSLVTDDRLIYLTDSAAVPYRFKDIDYWLVEANYSLKILDEKVASGMDATRANRVINTHMSIEKLQYYFEGFDHLPAKEIYLIHLSDDNSDAEAFKHKIQEVTGVPVYIA